MHIFPTTFLEIAVYIYMTIPPPQVTPRGGGGLRLHVHYLRRGRGELKLLSSSKSHNFHGGRDESGLLYSLILP